MAPYWLDTREMTEAEANRYFGRRALQYIVESPSEFSRLAARKAFYTFTSIRPEQQLASPRNLVGLGANVLLFVVGTFGLTGWLRDRQQRSRSKPYAMLLIPLVLTTLLVVAIGPIGMRYRIALDGILWICAGMGVLRLADGWSIARRAFSSPFEVQSALVIRR
jgi:hypothetical protein